MKILAIIAHPDDETILCGGTLALLARAGAEVHFLCATRGEGGEMGEPKLCERADLGRVREQEMRCAVDALGGAGVEFLGYVDPAIGENEELHPYTDDFDELTHRLRDYIQQLRPAAVITHGSNGEYGHPAHVLTHRAVFSALRPAGALQGALSENYVMETPQVLFPALYTFSPSFPEHPRPRLANADDLADLVLDISPAFEQKVAAALCHRTQNALFVRRASKRAGRKLAILEVLMKLEGLHCLHGTSKNGIEELLKPWLKVED